MRKLPLSAAIAALPLFIHAPASHAEDKTLPEVQVREHGEPASKQDQLPTTSDSARMLEGLPGVSAYSAGGVSALPVLRGLADDRIKIRIDGAETTSACGNHMNAPLSYIDPTQVSAVKVLAGVTPVSLGGDNIGGTVDLRSAQPTFATNSQERIVSGKASIQTRSIDNSLSAGISATTANDRLSLTYSGATTQAKSYKDGNGNKVLDTLYRSDNQSFTVAAQGSGNRWALKAGEQTIPYQGFPNQAMDMVKNHGVFANLGYTGQFGWGALDAKVYWQDTRHAMGFFTQEKPGTMPMETHGRDLGYTLKADLPLRGNDSLRVGHEFHRTELDDWWPAVPGSMMMGPKTYMNINGGSRERIALFAEWDGQVSERWTALLGTRHETVKTDTGKVQGYSCGMMCATDTAAANAFNARSHGKRDNNLDLTALFQYESAPTSSYEFGYARKTRSPNLYERYTWGRGNMAMAMIGWFGDGNGYVGNIDLKPEVAHTISASIDWHDASKKGWSAKLSPFYTHVTDFIDVDDLGPGGMMGPTRRLQFANHDAHLYGVNFSWRLPVWENNAYGSGTFKGKFDWTRGKRDDGGDLYHIMPANLALTLEQTRNGWTHSAELIMVAAKSAVDNRRVEYQTGGYSLMNLSTRYEFSNGLGLQAGIRNLFNRQYSLPLGGVNLAAATAVPLYGQGRSVDLGVSLKF